MRRQAGQGFKEQMGGKKRYAYPLVTRAKCVQMTEDICKLFVGEQQVVGNSHSTASIFSGKQANDSR